MKLKTKPSEAGFISLTLHTPHSLLQKEKASRDSLRESVSLEGKRKSELLPQFAFSFCAQVSSKFEPESLLKVNYVIFLGMIKSLKDLEVICNETQFEKILSHVEQSIPIEYTTSICNNFKASGFFRARTHNCLEGNFDEKTDICKAFLDEGEFWNVPENLKHLIKIGRCNLDGESMFYCSTDKATAILEAKPKNKYVSVASFELRNPQIFLGSRMNFIGRGYLSKISDIDKITTFSQEERDNNVIEVDNYLDELFHKDITENEEPLYKLSVAVTKCMMKDMMTKESETFIMHGLVYSSIVRDKQNYNIVYVPDHVRTNYHLTKIETFKVVEDNDAMIVLRKMRSGFTLESELTNRQISWFTDVKDDLEIINKKNFN